MDGKRGDDDRPPGERWRKGDFFQKDYIKERGSVWCWWVSGQPIALLKKQGADHRREPSFGHSSQLELNSMVLFHSIYFYGHLLFTARGTNFSFLVVSFLEKLSLK